MKTIEQNDKEITQCDIMFSSQPRKSTTHYHESYPCTKDTPLWTSVVPLDTEERQQEMLSDEDI